MTRQDEIEKANLEYIFSNIEHDLVAMARAILDKKYCKDEYELSRFLYDKFGEAHTIGFENAIEWSDKNPRAEVLALVEAASKCAGGCDEWQQKAVSEFKVVFVGCGECDKCNLEKALTAWRKSRGINGK